MPSGGKELGVSEGQREACRRWWGPNHTGKYLDFTLSNCGAEEAVEGRD